MTKKPRYRVIIVDDYPETATVTCQLLGLLGHDCHAAEAGEAALVYCDANVPDIAILDLAMPGISGYDVARQLRRTYGATIYLAAMSGLARPEDRALAIEAGFDRFLLKPIDAAALESLIEQVTISRARFH